MRFFTILHLSAFLLEKSGEKSMHKRGFSKDRLKHPYSTETDMYDLNDWESNSDNSTIVFTIHTGINHISPHKFAQKAACGFYFAGFKSYSVRPGEK